MADSDKNIRITTNKNKGAGNFPTIVFTGSAAGTSVVSLQVLDDNTVSFSSNEGQIFSLDANLSTGTIWSVNDISGTPLLRASAGGTIGIAELGSGVIVGIGQTNPKYKLDVQGWVGFASTGDGSYTILIENGLATGNNALSIRAANALRFYNSGNTLYTGFIGAQAGVNTTYTLPPRTPTGTGTSYLSSSIDGVMAWVAAPTSGGSGSVNSGTANYAAYYATTTNAVSENANLQFTGAGVSVGGNINSTSTTSGSLYVRGGVGITGNAFIGGTTNITSSQASISTASGALVVTGGVGIGGSLYTATSVPSSVSGVVFSNGIITTGTWSGSTITAFYGGTGYNSYTKGDILVGAGNTFIKLNVGTDNFVLTASASSPSGVTWASVPASAASSVAVAPTVVNSQFSITTVSTASGTGLGLSTISTFVVNPATNIVSVSGFAVTASTASISSVTGALIVSGGAGIAGSLFTGTSTPSSISGVIHNNGAVTANSYNKVAITAPATSATLTLFNGSTLATSGANSLTFTTTANSSLTVPTAGTLTTTGNKLSDFAATTSLELWNTITGETGSGALVFATSPTFTTSVVTDSASFNVFNTTATTVNAFQAGTAISIGAATGTFTHNNATNLFNQSTASTSTSTGAIVVTGGAAVGQTLSVGGSLSIFNGANYTGFRFSGSASTTYTLPLRTPTGTGTSFLSSSIDGVMAWVAAPTSGSATPGGSSGQIQYNNGGAFGGVSGFTYADNGAGSSIVKFNLPSVFGDAGVLNLGPGSFQGSGSPGFFVGTANGTFIAINAGSGFTGNYLDFQKNGVSGFAVSTDGKVTIGNNVWSLPTTSGTSGQVLTSGGNGQQATWTTVTGSSSSGGTVYAGTVNQIAFYGATGNTVGGSATLTNNTSTGVVDINHTTESTSTSTGALVVDGGAGIAKSLFVGTTLSVGQAPGYNVTNNLASFVSTVDTYNQVVIQNKSSGVSASADFVLNNNLSTDTTYYGNLGINSSNFGTGTGALGAPNAVYLSSTSGPLVLGTTTAHPIRFVVNGGATDVMYIAESGTAISVLTNHDLRNGNKTRFFSTGSNLFTSLAGGNVSQSYDLILPTDKVGAGVSVIIVNSDGQMYFATPGSGIAFSSATANIPVIRAKRSITMQFCAGYTPIAAGPDNVILKIPDSSVDGVTDVTYRLREFDIRVETPSSGSSRLQLEKLTSTGAFVLGGTGYSMIGGFGITLTGAGTYFTSTASFAAGALVTSNDKLRVNWTLLNATHANFSIQLTMEEV